MNKKKVIIYIRVIWLNSQLELLQEVDRLTHENN